jgi:hypothetical protein
VLPVADQPVARAAQIDTGGNVPHSDIDRWYGAYVGIIGIGTAKAWKTLERSAFVEPRSSWKLGVAPLVSQKPWEALGDPPPPPKKKRKKTARGRNKTIHFGPDGGHIRYA